MKSEEESVKESLRVGVSFGLTSAVITTLGLMVGLNASTGSRLVVIGGILTIAIADAFSDALGIHISEESENEHTTKEIWMSTVFTFLAKFLFAMTFLVPVLLFQLPTAMVVSVAWGLMMLGLLSFKIALNQKEKPYKIIAEHIFIAAIVVLATNYIGTWISKVFN